VGAHYGAEPASGRARCQDAQCRRIGFGIAAHADCHVIAALLSRFTSEPRKPPCGRRVEEERLDERLNCRDPLVTGAQMLQLVRENRLEVFPGEGDVEAAGDNQTWTSPAGRRRILDLSRLDDGDRARIAQTQGHPPGGVGDHS